MNEILTTGEQVEFLPEIIKRRGFLRAKYWSWDDFRNGLVTFADKTTLRVLFQTGVNASTSYFKITASEVNAGLWQLIYSSDMENFYRVAPNQEPPERITEPDIANIFGGNQNGRT